MLIARRQMARLRSTHFPKASVSMTIRVFLIDDHALVRTGMRLILGTDADIEVVGEKLRAMMPWIAANKIVDKSKN